MKWEYKFTTSESGEDIKVWINRLNAYGDSGWELVGVIPETERNVLGAYFKRPKTDKN
jgi:hypothetical protein